MLTSAQEALLPVVRDEWLAHGLSCEPANRPSAEAGVRAAYEAAGLTPPGVVIWLGSPLAGALAAGMLSQVWAQVRAQVRDRVGDQVRDQVWDRVWPQVLGQVRGQVWTQVRAQVWDRVWPQVEAQVEDQVLAQVWAQARAQVGDQVRDQVRSQVIEKVWSQVQDQVRSQVIEKVRSQVQDQIWAQVGAQVEAQVWAQVIEKAEAQVRDQVVDQVWAQVRDQVGDQVIGKVVYGSHDAAWLSFYDALGRCGIDTSPLDGLATVGRSAGWWWPFEHAVILTDRPATMHMDNAGRLHAETRPALTYRDGLCDIYSWHGTRVPADLIRDGWGTTRILKEPNAEVRRCAIERLGWPKFIADAGLAQVGGTVPDPGNPGQTLALYDVPEAIYDEPVRVLVATNGTPERDGTRHTFGLVVPADIGDPLHAAAWTYDLDPTLYATAQVRR